jgi:hypothetical protein
MVDTNIQSRLSNQYLYEFNPNSCNSSYFHDLFELLKIIHPEKEIYKRMKKKTFKELNIQCEYPILQNCKADEFFFENKRQILLGRFFDTIGCFYNCSKHFFAMAMDSYSLFKNDVFIRYILSKSHIFIKSKRVDIETVFPIRILLSKKHRIPGHKLEEMKNSLQFTHEIRNPSHGPPLFLDATNTNNVKKISRFTSSMLHKYITASIPINHIIARELCLLYFMNLYFYVVKHQDQRDSFKPFILVSKYNLTEIKKFYKKSGIPFPELQLLYKKKDSN